MILTHLVQFEFFPGAGEEPFTGPAVVDDEIEARIVRSQEVVFSIVRHHHVVASIVRSESTDTALS